MPPVIKSAPSKNRGSLLQITLLLAALLAILFCRSFLTGYVHFSNDGPLAMQKADFLQLPAAFTGAWDDLNWIGINGATFPFTFTAVCKMFLGPVGFSKFFQPLAILILGLCAWTFFKRLKLSPLACTLGAIAASLNSAFLGTACWGVAAQLICFGMNYLALALVVSNNATTPRWLRWLRLVLAGMAVGMGVMEGADNGAIFSMFVAAYVFYHSLFEEGAAVKNIAVGIGRVVVIAVFAGFMATQNVVGLIGTSITGVAGMGQTADAKAANWDFATQWSNPKIEALGLFVPGLFGYRMDTPKDLPEFMKSSYKGGNYWGGVGRDPAWDRYFRFVSTGKFYGGEQVRISFPNAPGSDIVQMVNGNGEILLAGNHTNKVYGMTAEEVAHEVGNYFSSQPTMRQAKVSVISPPGSLRFSGGGFYAGVLVCLVALWAIAQSFRKNDSVFTLTQRRLIWFWLVAMVVALLLSFGRFAPFYQIIYALPYFSTIRNPCKFIAVFSWALIIVFSYGIHGISRRYLDVASVSAASPMNAVKSWWKKAHEFDRTWIKGCLVVTVIFLIGAVVYSMCEEQLADHLQSVGFPNDPNVMDNKLQIASQIAAFSVRQVFWFVGILVVSVGMLAFVFRGSFIGRSSTMGGSLLAFVLIGDLGRADMPYIVHWNYEQKYLSNTVIDRLKVKPYEHRTIMSPFPAPAELGLFSNIYKYEWSQHLFTYNNIPSLDIIQYSRPPVEYIAYETALSPRSTVEYFLTARRWELTSVRYILGPTISQMPTGQGPDGRPIFGNFDTLDVFNNALDGGRNRFRLVTRFEIVPKPGIAQPTQLEELTAIEAPNGRYGLYEFTGALPHAALYSHWQVNTNDEEVLKTLSSTNFNPHETVLVSQPLSTTPATESTNQNAGTVSFKSYKPADIVFEANAEQNCVLMLNDKHDPTWRVTVDGKPAEMLRCNYIMRGVFLTPGKHTVEFYFRPSMKPGYITLSAMVLAVLLSGVMIYSERRLARREQDEIPEKPRSK